MAKYTYLIFNALVFFPVLFLSLHYDVKPHKNWRQLLAVFLSVSLPFIVWDIWAAKEGHWLFSEKYISAPRLAGLPFEEILFFVTVPFAMIYVWLVVNKHFRGDWKTASLWSRFIYSVALLFCTLLTFIYWENGYTRSVALAGIFTSLVLMYSRRARSKQFLIFQLLHLLLFFVCNTFLTALPVISYGSDSIIGARIGTIPLEDFLFSYSLISLSVIIFGLLPKEKLVIK